MMTKFVSANQGATAVIPIVVGMLKVIWSSSDEEDFCQYNNFYYWKRLTKRILANIIIFITGSGWEQW